MLVAQSFASFVTKKCLEGEVPRLGSWPWFLKDVVGWIYFALAGGGPHPIWTRTSWIEAGEGRGWMSWMMKHEVGVGAETETITIPVALNT
jgi:hypothetical protein